MIKKVILRFYTFILILTMLAGCACQHEWKEATCTTPKTCTRCGTTEGIVAEHIYKDATCTAPKTCEVCSTTIGEALGHSFTEATCTTPKICTVCKEITGNALGHNFTKATYAAPKTCVKCGYTAGTALKLSDSCDRVLATGTDHDGNVFELVANEKEDYSGTTVQIGVIKNNEWTIPLTTESPFIGEDGLLYQSYNFSDATGSIYDEYYAVFHYIGNGCFYYENRIWNGNNGSAYKWEEGMHIPVVQITETEWIIDNDGKVILKAYGENYQILDTTTMQISTMNLKYDGYDFDYCAPHSEGLFACMNNYSDVKTNGFYDLNGNKVIDLSCYIMAYDSYDHWGNGTYMGPLQKLVFENGECTFKIKNDQGTEYYITIDKTGAVIRSSEA